MVRFSRKKKSRKSRKKTEEYLLCPYCNAEYTSSKQVISIGPKTVFTSVTRRIYGCYNCKRILGLGSKSRHHQTN